MSAAPIWVLISRDTRETIAESPCGREAAGRPPPLRFHPRSRSLPQPRHLLADAGSHRRDPQNQRSRRGVIPRFGPSIPGHRVLAGRQIRPDPTANAPPEEIEQLERDRAWLRHGEPEGDTSLERI